jgi:hypothetical protein
LMKKVLALLLAFLCATGVVFAEDYSKGGMLLSPGTIDVNAGLGYGWYYGVDIGAGAEYIIGKFDVAKDVPLSFGVAARASLFVGAFDSDPLGLGAFGTLHFNWGALKWPEGLAWLNNVDSYIGLGFDFLPGFWFDSIGGSSYFISKTLAVNVEGGIRGSQFGVLLKL